MQRPTSLTLSSRPSINRRNRLISEPTLQCAAQSPVSCAQPIVAPSAPYTRVRTPSGYSNRVSSQPSTPVIQEGFYFPAVPINTTIYSTTQPSTTLYGTLPKVTTAPHPSRTVQPAATILETSHPSLLNNPPAPYSHCENVTLLDATLPDGQITTTNYMSLPRPVKTPPTCIT